MSQNEQEHLGQKKSVFIFTMSLIFTVILFRFFSIQIIGGEEYSKKSEQNRIRQETVTPIRGQMYDRNNVLLVDNVPAYSISVIPYELKDTEYFYAFIEEYFPEELEQIQEKLKKAPAHRPLKILSVDLNGLALFVENKLDLPGVLHQIEPRRAYPSGIRASHFFGYIKEIDEKEIEELGKDTYRAGDLNGKYGLEKEYESVLRGKKGYRYVEVNALGQEMGEIITPGTKKPVPGNKLILTLDRDLQKTAEKELEGRRGGIVAIDPNNGEILTAVSKPDYDPNFFNRTISPQEWEEFQNNPNNPQYNRVSGASVPPGSTFKIVAAIAALNDTIISPDKKYGCSGSYRFGRDIKRCHKPDGHGTVNLIQAIARSCNIYFYQVAQNDLGIDSWAKYAAMFEFGQLTGLDSPDEEELPGTLPDRIYLDEKHGEGQWGKGHLANQIIGQGGLITTPLQMARFAGAIGTKGKIVTPHFLKDTVNAESGVAVPLTGFPVSQITDINDEVWDLVRQGMYDVVYSEFGTAKSMRRVQVPVAGKTGTAQNGTDTTHAWFIAFAPFEQPEVAIAVFVEFGGSGSGTAAPIARNVLRKYFALKEERKNKAITSASGTVRK